MNIAYIDDRPDIEISKVLISFIKLNKEYLYNEITFGAGFDFEKLLNDDVVRLSDIIIVDSYLFQNNTASDNKFFGEEFIVLLKKFFPFKEFLLISQNEIDTAALSISKFKKNSFETAHEYYNRILIPEIELKAKVIGQTQFFLNKFEKNEDVDDYIKNQILDNALGNSKYEMLEKHDIDFLINEFRKICEK